MDKKSLPNHSIIIFDGICNFCNSSVNFIISRDYKDTFKFAPMQSPTGQQMLATHNISSDNIDTFLLVKNGKAFIKSDAALAIAQELRRPWNYLVILKLIPRPIRDYFYSLIARNRYKWFGKREHCMMPTPELKNKFLT
ncbi:MAG: thiol-disulfide oxidoreductase DCC family protein [Agarilytica sp.]